MLLTGVRIIGGDKPNTGLVEIHGDEGWGTICTDNRSWDIRSARVVCRSLGYEDAVMAQEAHTGLYGYSMGPAYITDVMCNGG